MKKRLIRVISLFLVFATVLPALISCDGTGGSSTGGENSGGDNTGGENGGENMSKYFTLKETSSTDYTPFDLTDSQFLEKNNDIKLSVTEKDGKTVVKWKAPNSMQATLNKTYDMTHDCSIRFSVYSEEATGAQVEVSFVNPAKPMNADWRKVARFTVNFVGWKHFDFVPTEISGYGATNNLYDRIRFSVLKNEDGTMPDDTLYITSITLTKKEFEVVVPDGVDVNDASLYTGITEHCRDTLVGNASVSDTAEYKAKLPGVNAACKTSLDLYNATWQGESTPEHTLFGITVVKEYWKGERDTQIFYEKILPMAKAYAMVGSDYYHSEEVLAAILNSLEYGYKYYYGPSLMEYGLYGNWWNWEIGVPLSLHLILVLIEDKVTPELCKKYLEVFDTYVPYPNAKGGNKIWLSRFVILSGALEHDAEKLCYASHYMNDLFDYIDNYLEDEGGFFTDGSFIQHTHHPYTAGYGGNYMGDLPQLMYYLSGSRFYPQQDNVNNHFKWVFDSFRPIMYKKRLMSSLMGRNVGRGVNEDTQGYAASMILMSYYCEDPQLKAELENTVAYFMKLFNTDFSSKVSVFLVNYAKELYARLKDVEIDDYEMAKVFGMMCRVVQHGPKYGVCISLSNGNISKYESINGETLTGWYLGDGMIYIYNDSTEYAFNSPFYWYANPYLMPGTTVNSAERVKTASAALLNASMYAGGASQGKYASVGFILDYDTASPTFKDKKDSTIFAKKSYFLFDNEIVCVGSDISDMSGTEVKTVLDNRLWRDVDVFSVNGQAISSPATVETAIDARTMHFTNMGGYVLLKDDGCTLIYKKATNGYHGTQTYPSEPSEAAKNGSATFLELYLSHGVGASNGKLENNNYFYAYLPSATAEETESYSQNPDVELLRRTSRVHAVYEKALGIVACNYFDKNSGETVKISDAGAPIKSLISDTVCSVMISKNENGETVISASDPTQEYSKIVFTIELNGQEGEFVSSDTGVSAKLNGDKLTVTVDVNGACGKTFSLTVK